MKNKVLKKDNFKTKNRTGQIIVQKIWWCDFRKFKKILATAKRISSLHKSGIQVVACVSAMGQSTNNLISLAHQISANPNRRELDMLLSTGERVSMALVSMALNDHKCPAISFTGSQAGILTNDSHVSAMILDVKAFRVKKALKKNQVVVLAGFQGVSPKTKEITTLGRGGTDTTAVAMAAYLKAKRCEILKDVAGVFTADPKLIKNAKPIRIINYQQMLEMTFWGAKVLHYRSVELAKQKNVKIYIGPASKNDKKGTMVVSKKEYPMFESSKVLSINTHSWVLSLKIKNTTSLCDLKKNLEQNEIPFPQIISTQQLQNFQLLLVTGPKEVLTAILNFKSKDYSVMEKNFCSVTATCTGINSDSIHEKTFQALNKNKIHPLFSISSSMSISFILAQKDQEKAIKALHKLI